MFNPETDLDQIPTSPGVYIMRGKGGTVIYVGKALNLKNRVRQYFGQSSDTRYFISRLGEFLVDLDVILTANEKEALILESELIKKYKPRFNAVLKDDKSFLYLKLDESKLWPHLEVVRKLTKERTQKEGKDGREIRYFGPYHIASRVRETMKLIERHFQIRNCDDRSMRNRSRPCLQYEIKRCPGPCVLPVDPEVYRENVHEVVLFLQGRQRELRASLQKRMEEAAEDLRFEQAARLRDQIAAIDCALEPQQIIEERAIDRDVCAIHREGAEVSLVVLEVRRGRMEEVKRFDFDDMEATDEELMTSFLHQLYTGGAFVPDEVLVSCALESSALEERLAELKGRKVAVRQPKRGAGLKLLEMAQKNVDHAFSQRERSTESEALARIQKKLHLSRPPRRIECYDISIFQGAHPVASRVVYEGLVPKKSDYRRYKIRDVEGTNDFAMMKEVLSRRLSKVDEDPAPDLLVVDGGKGQLSMACAVLAELGIQMDVVGLAKARTLKGNDEPQHSFERIFLPNAKDPIRLMPKTEAFEVLTGIRDEAHRFAITFHRFLRDKATLHSVLEDIEGVGAARKTALLQRFGSVFGVLEASFEELKKVVGEPAAQAIWDAVER